MSTANLLAVERKITAALATHPECFITHPAELAALKELSSAELDKIARAHGWRIVSRVGGRQIEFYQDVAARLASESD